MSPKYAKITFLVAVVIAGSWWWLVPRTPSQPDPDATYFRLKVALTYKGAPVDADIVVGCGVHDSFSVAQGGSTSEVMGMTASVFGLRMPEGHAVVIRTVYFSASPCQGKTTAKGDFPADWLPLIIWYDRDDEFAHGIGYMTQDAYTRPDAKFGFRRATIEKANRADYETFLKTGPKNLKPSYLTDWGTHRDRPRLTDPDTDLAALARHPTSAWRYSEWPPCRAVRRVRLDDGQRQRVRAMWPSEHPRYWTAQTGKERNDLLHHLLTEDQYGADLEVYQDKRSDPPFELYPIDTDQALRNISATTPADDRYVQRAIIDPALKGQAYCDADARPALITAITGRPATVRQDRITCNIDEFKVPNQEACWGFKLLVFDKDEYAIIYQYPTLEG